MVFQINEILISLLDSTVREGTVSENEYGPITQSNKYLQVDFGVCVRAECANDLRNRL